MKLSDLAVLAPLLVFALSNGCSSGDDDDGAAGSAGSATAGTSGSGGSGTAGTSAGTAGTSAGTGGSSAGSGGSSAGSAGTSSGATDSPSDTTQAGIDAFLDAGSYKTADWVDNGAAHEGGDPHAMVQSFFNKTLRQSTAAATNPPATGSMVVKELLQGTTVIGHAVMLRTASSWIYYCDSSVDNLCASGHTAGTIVYGTSAGTTGCSCHGAGTIITTIPPP